MNKTTHIRLLTTVSFLVMLAFPLSAQEKADSVFTFRFLFGKDMFFAPGMNNGAELTRLYDCVEQYKDLIIGHDISLQVDGYCISRDTDAEKLGIARIRSNRVKSELIVRKGLTENCFITRNHPEQGDFVTVFFINTKDGTRFSPQGISATVSETNAAQDGQQDAGEPPVVPVSENDSPTIGADTVEDAESDSTSAQQPAAAGSPDTTGTTDNLSAVKSDGRLALKTNFIGYAVLMPNVEIEWMFADRWSAALEVQGAWYAKSDPHKVYRLATVTPELRFWAVDRSRWHGMYVGLFGGAGMYDLSNGKKGHEGEGAMAGLSAGYMWPIGRHLSLDAGIGVGYLRVRDKVYTPLDGHFLYQYTKNINYIGPLRLRLSLVWRFQSAKNQSVK